MIHIFRKGEGPETLVLFHGTGGDEHDLIPVAELVSPDASILSLRGNVSEQGMNRFFRRLGEGVFDEEDIRFRAEEIMAFLEDAVKAHDLDRERLTALGYSNGANIIAAILLLHGSVFRKAILLHPMVPLKEVQKQDLSDTQVFIGAGEDDPMVGKENTRRLEAALKESGASVSAHWYQNGHTLVREEVSDAAAWFAGTG